MPQDSSLSRFRATLQGALVHLEQRRKEINDLNVFPVADGDTGDNMVLTLEACLAEVDRLAEATGEAALGDVERVEIVDSVARAALLGARGNSGVILSQLIRGAAEELVSRPGELIDPTLVGAALARAAQRAYASVRQPAEGTILTVMRDMAVAIATDLAHGGAVALEADADPREQDRRIADVLERAVRAGEESVRRGPELLPALREAGVVDAGGYGVVVLFAGCVAALRGEDAPVVEHHRAPARVTHPEHDSSTFRFCTNFAVSANHGERLAAAPHFVRLLEDLGDSVLVVGDHATLRVHVHTDNPASATELFDGTGEVSRLDVADMHAQVADRERRLGTAVTPTQRCGALAIYSGEGLRARFAELGCDVLDGGPTMNPSTYDILAGIHAVQAEEVVVLVNSSNVVMAAQAAADMSEKTVRVIASSEQQAGLVAALALVSDRSAADNAQFMEHALEEVRTGTVAPAARADAQGRFAVGDAVGYVGDELVAWGDPESTLRAVLGRIADGAELITVLEGADPPLAADAIDGLAPGDVELEFAVGGQPSRWWLLSAE